MLRLIFKFALSTLKGCLQVYSETQANGQQFLYTLNRNDFNEHFYALNKLSFHYQDNMLVTISAATCQPTVLNVVVCVC